MPLLLKKRVSTKHLASGVLTIAIVALCQVSTAAFPHLPFLRARRSEQKCTLSCEVESQFQPSIDVAQASKAISTCQNPTLGAKDDDRATLRQQQAEWTLGNKLAADLERQERLISDPITIAYLNRIEGEIVRHSTLVGCFTVKLIKDIEPNAYSLPGGFLYVTTGLVLMTDNEAALAAALAHETGHVTARHFTVLEKRRRIWGRFALAGGPAGYFVRRSLGPILSMKLLRHAEFEADELAMKYLTASGYDPAEFRRALQTLSEDSGRPASFFVRLFDDHPMTADRIKRLDKIKHQVFSPETNYTVDTSEFQQIRARTSILVNSDASQNKQPKNDHLAGIEYHTIGSPPYLAVHSPLGPPAIVPVIGPVDFGSGALPHGSPNLAREVMLPLI